MKKAILLGIQDVSEIVCFSVLFCGLHTYDMFRLILYCLQQPQQTTKAISRHRSLL